MGQIDVLISSMRLHKMLLLRKRKKKHWLIRS